MLEARRMTNNVCSRSKFRMKVFEQHVFLIRCFSSVLRATYLAAPNKVGAASATKYRDGTMGTFVAKP